MADIIITKRCSHCKQFKPTSEFYKRIDRSCGYQSWCKICHHIFSHKYQRTPQGKLAYKFANKRFSQSPKGKKVRRRAMRKYNQTPKGKKSAHKANYRYYQSEKGKEKHRRMGKILRQKYPIRIKARHVIEYAIRTKHLPHPVTLKCYYCNKQATQYHHWHGYDQEHWLDVVPACQLYDIKAHKNLHKGL